MPLFRVVILAATTCAAASLCGACNASGTAGAAQGGAGTSAGMASAAPGVVAGQGAAGATTAAGAAGLSGAAGTAAGSGGGMSGVGGVSGSAAGTGAAPAAGSGGAAGMATTVAGAPANTAGMSGSSGASVTAGSAAAAGAGAPAAAPMPDPKFLVAATGTCPEFRDGYATFTPGGVSRRVLLYAAPKPDLHGPLLFSWHSTLPSPEDAVAWIGQSVINEIKAKGGIVAAPASGNATATRPWDNTPMGPRNTDSDQKLMDEIVACAISKAGIDVRRIHATGMSAGGLKTAVVSFLRSGYLASVVAYSGGFTAADNPMDQDPQNPVAAMILYGGATDISPVDGINYTDASNRYLDKLKARGSFAFLCNHGGGHSVPNDSQASAWRFLQDHPYGTKPSPYAMQLPSGFLRYCSLPSR